MYNRVVVVIAREAGSIPLVWAKYVVQMCGLMYMCSLALSVSLSSIFFFFLCSLRGGRAIYKFNVQIKECGIAVKATIKGASRGCCVCLLGQKWCTIAVGSFLIIQTKCSLTGHDKDARKVVGSKKRCRIGFCG